MTDVVDFTHHLAARQFVEDLGNLGATFVTVDEGVRRGYRWSCTGVANSMQVRETLEAVGRASEPLQQAFLDEVFRRWPPEQGASQ